MKKVKMTTFQQQAEAVFFAHPAVLSLIARVDLDTRRSIDDKGSEVIVRCRPEYMVTIHFRDDSRPSGTWNTYGDGKTPESAIHEAKVSFEKEFPGAFDVRQEIEVESSESEEPSC